MMAKKMLDELEGSIIVPIYEHKFDVQSCTNYRVVILMSHKTLKSYITMLEFEVLSYFYSTEKKILH